MSTTAPHIPSDAEIAQHINEQTGGYTATTTPSVRDVVEATRRKVREDLRMGREHQEGEINWITSVFMGLFHVGAFAALFFFSWKNLLAFAVMYFLAINVGIGMGYHRLLTHRGYRVPRWLELIISGCGTLALEGGPIFLGGNTPRAPPVQRPRRRSAHAA